MAAQIQEWIKIGTDLGLKENELQVFVKEQQTMAREEREKERTVEKEKAQEETKRTLAKDENKTKKLLAVIEGIDNKILRDEFIRLQKMMSH